MKYCVDRIVRYCFKNGLISESQIPWLRYSIEKRLSSIIGIIPFALLALLLSDFGCAFCFILSFCVLRSRINGYHSKTLIGCILVSLAIEILSFKIIYPVLTPITAMATCIVCFVILILFAPYNHPNMHYSADEVLALKKSIRRRVAVLFLLLSLFTVKQLISALHGLTLGIAMAAFMLCLAYITEWRKT